MHVWRKTPRGAINWFYCELLRDRVGRIVHDFRVCATFGWRRNGGADDMGAAHCDLPWRCGELYSACVLGIQAAFIPRDKYVRGVPFTRLVHAWSGFGTVTLSESLMAVGSSA